jgi:uncharacterized protein YrrD
MRSSEITRRPVVTLEGEDVAQIKDIIYAESGGQVGGFTLNGRGFLAGTLKTALAWGAVVALGPDAVMIRDEGALTSRDALVAEIVGKDGGGGGDVLGSRVLTDDGKDLGKVLDVIIEVTNEGQPLADVVGYEIEPAENLGGDLKKVLVPLPDTIAASGQHLIVPSTALDFVTNDLAGFGAAMRNFREQRRSAKSPITLSTRSRRQSRASS